MAQSNGEADESTTLLLRTTITTTRNRKKQTGKAHAQDTGVHDDQNIWTEADKIMSCAPLGAQDDGIDAFWGRGGGNLKYEIVLWPHRYTYFGS